MVELEHSFLTGKPVEESWQTILDLERLMPHAQGCTVTERTAPNSVKAEILVRMGAMSMKFGGTVTIVERDDDARRAVLEVKSREVGGQGYAHATVTFVLSDGGGVVHTSAQITGKAASMGESVVDSVLDALIKDFTERLGAD
jgi:carbon monoxide dehydrogenase subunit G